ncbi:hypothetical protein K502DRAFT_324131 [Neoconidiobolus thromboides FSU 785]|nr:hypothetical protein K502DRAFT_324131 [Neoconidiobolus thromboides FSU 785]
MFSNLLELVFLYLLFLKSPNCSDVPGISGANGDVINDVMYVVGGLDLLDFTEDEDINESNSNSKVYYIDLRKGMDLNNDQEKDWEFDFLIDQPLNRLLYHNVIKKDNNSEDLLIIGGMLTPLEESVKVFNTKTKTWKIDPVGSQFIKNLNFTKSGDSHLSYGPFASTLTRNDLNPDELILFGGGYTSEKMKEEAGEGAYHGLVIYNTKYDKWRTVGENSQYSIGTHNSVIHNGNLMLFGGVDTPSNEFIGFDTIVSFNIKDEKWHNQTTSGEFPSIRSIFGLKKVNNLVYILGGTDDQNVERFTDSSLYVLNLDSLTWEKYYIPGLVSTILGYLEHYNGYLLYGFGLRLELYSKMQIISLNNYTLVNRLPSAKEMEESKPKSQVSTIVSGSIGGLVGVILLIALTYFLYKKLKQYRIVKKVPLTIPEPTHSNTVFIIKDPNFMLDDDEPEFDQTL